MSSRCPDDNRRRGIVCRSNGSWSQTINLPTCRSFAISVTADTTATGTRPAPFLIVDDGAQQALFFGSGLQDEWWLPPQLILNHGARFDNAAAPCASI